MENLTPTAIGIVMASILGGYEVAKAGLRFGARKLNGGSGRVHKSDLVALRHEISLDVAESVSEIKSYMQDEFRDFGERMARIEQRVDDGERR